MHEKHPIRHVVQDIYDRAEAGARAVIDRATASSRLTAHRHTSPPMDAEPTIHDLDMAGAEWAPLSDTEDDGYEIARDNGYVVLRSDDPDAPIQIIDEDDWDAFINGDLDIDLG